MRVFIGGALVVLVVFTVIFIRNSEDSPPHAADSNAAITMASPTEDDPLIPVGGTLSNTKGCLVLLDADKGEADVGSTLAMWPYGTTWEVGTDRVTLAGGEVFMLGGKLRGSGGIRVLSRPLPFDTSTNAAIRACEDRTNLHALSIIYNTEGP